MAPRKKITIVGSGVAAMTAAWSLSGPNVTPGYDISVYQLGWRLGGKGASGRDAHNGQRILEHGLHMFLGFYDNAFRLVRECYEELDRPEGHPMREWTDAFKKTSLISLAERQGGVWRTFAAHFPQNERIPGTGVPGEPLTPLRFVGHVVPLALELLESVNVADQPEPANGSERIHGRSALRHILAVGRVSTVAQVASATLAGAALRTLASWLDDPTQSESELQRCMCAITSFLEEHSTALLEGEHATRRLWEIVVLLMAAIRGVVAHDLHRQDRWDAWEAIDDYDLRAWLRMHGAPESSLKSALLKGIYDIAFAYEDGDSAQPRYAAGQAVRAAGRFFFEYKGALFWEMQAGMGDVLFAPLYLALKARGVKFHFFHRLERIELSSDNKAIESLVFSQQVPGDVSSYDPLIVVKGLECWPAEPNWEQIEGGRMAGVDLEAPETVSAGPDVKLSASHGDFDEVILGVAIGNLPRVAASLLRASPRFEAIVANVRTVRTQSVQLWFNVSRHGLGWDGPKTHGSGYVEPFDSWSDMTQLISAEDWQEPRVPRALMYLVNAMPTARLTAEASPLQDQMELRRNAIEFLRHDAGLLWPSATRVYPDDFKWELLFDLRDGTAEQQTGPSRLDAQYMRANSRPSDQYTQSLPGSTRYRIAPGDTGFERLTIAGDWTWNALNVGCVEAAVTSGLLAASAIAGLPYPAEIFGLGADFEPEWLGARRLGRARTLRSDHAFAEQIRSARAIMDRLVDDAAKQVRDEAAREPHSALKHMALVTELFDREARAIARRDRIRDHQHDGNLASSRGSPTEMDRFRWVETLLDRYGDAARGELLSGIPTHEPRRFLYDLVAEYPRRGGRMLRPTICLATAQAFGASLEDALPTAAALEMLHNAFLVHDDIEDESLLRRGAATLNASHGVALALNAGDAALVLAMRLLHRNFGSLRPQIAMAIVDETLRMVGISTEGQARDIGLRTEGRSDYSQMDYFDVIVKKTCWYTILLPLRLGALVGRRKTGDPARFYRFGFLLGAVFQIVDDLMNVTAELSAYGKEIGGDLYEGKPTLMLLYLLEQADRDTRARVAKLLATPRSARTSTEIAWLQAQLTRYGCVDQARAVARALAQDAQAEFDAAFADARDGHDKHFIAALPWYLLERERRSRPEAAAFGSSQEPTTAAP